MSALVRLRLDAGPSGSGGPAYGTQYDLGAGCPTCGSGAPQIGPLRIRASDFARVTTIASTYTGELLLSDAVADEVHEAAQSQGLELRQAEYSRSTKQGSIWQLLPTTTAPPLLRRESRLTVEQQCRTCLRDGHFTGSRFQPTFDSAPPVTALFTWERFGNGRLRQPFTRSHMAQPEILLPAPLYTRLSAACPALKGEPVHYLDFVG